MGRPRPGVSFYAGGSRTARRGGGIVDVEASGTMGDASLDVVALAPVPVAGTVTRVGVEVEETNGERSGHICHWAATRTRRLRDHRLACRTGRSCQASVKDVTSCVIVAHQASSSKLPNTH